MNKTVPMDLGNGVVHNLRFGTIGAVKLEEAGISLQDLSNRVDRNSLSVRDLTYLLLAELESARIKDRKHPYPWTLEQIDSLIDAAVGCEGDLIEFWLRYSPVIIQAFKNSFAVTIRTAEALTQRAAEAEAARQAVLNPPPPAEGDEVAEESGADRPTKPQDESTGDSHASGTMSSTSQPASESVPMTSGDSPGVSG